LRHGSGIITYNRRRIEGKNIKKHFSPVGVHAFTVCSLPANLVLLQDYNKQRKRTQFFDQVVPIMVIVLKDTR
jgi:hypothetical protein